MLIQLMKLHLSKVMFHDGGDQDCVKPSERKGYFRRSKNVDSLSMIGLCLVYLVVKKMERYLNRAQSSNAFDIAFGYRVL